MSDFEDLLGASAPAKRKVGRPSRDSLPEPFLGNFAPHVNHGITVGQLAAYFRSNRKAVSESLRNCIPIRADKSGALLYDFVEACSYLVPPRRDMRDFLRTVTDKDLPQELREAFWNAKIKEMRARAMAGDLWPTASVLEVLGETFKTLKTTTQLWVDTIDESQPLSLEQRQLLLELVDKLLNDLHEALVTQAKSTATESFVRDLDDDQA